MGTWGEHTLSACLNEIAEVKIGGSANPDVIPYFRRLIETGAGAAGRDPEDIGIVIGAVSVVDEDGAAARARARREVALYLPIVATLDPTLLLEPELLARLREAGERYDFDGAAALISDELLRRFAFAGTPIEIAEHIDSLFHAGASRVELGTPHGLTPERGLRLLGEKALARLKVDTFEG